MNSQTKSAFTRIYNQRNNDQVTKIAGKGKGKKAAAMAKSADTSDDEEDGFDDQLLDEEQIAEIRKGRQQEKEAK